MPLARTILLSLAFACAAAGPKRKAPDITPPQHDIDSNACLTISVTITPAATDAGVPIDDTDRLQLCRDLMQQLQVEFLMRHADGQTPYAFCARERGEENNNPHLQMHYDLAVSPTDAASTRAVLQAERDWLKAFLANATDHRLRVTVKKVKPKDRLYAYGYDQKDSGQEHYMYWQIGFTAAALLEALNWYRSKAGRSVFAGSRKMNKAPNAKSKQAAFEAGNLFTLSLWFIDQHGLKAIGKYLTLATIIAFALQTTCYRVDDSVVTGKNGGLSMEPARANSFMALQMLDPKSASTKELVSLIEQIVFGQALDHSSMYDIECRAKGLPTSAELIDEFDLTAAKALCANLAGRADEQPQSKAPKGGRFVVIDMLSSLEAVDSIALMRAAGLTGNEILLTEQMANACGHIAAGSSISLRNRGLDFATITVDDVRTLNTPHYIARANALLGHERTMWLSGDQILELASLDNPTPPDLTWLSGPAPINFWKVHFTRTLLDPTEHGQVHMMVVNTQAVYSLIDHGRGHHWFTVAWFIEPGTDEGAE